VFGTVCVLVLEDLGRAGRKEANAGWGRRSIVGSDDFFSVAATKRKGPPSEWRGAKLNLELVECFDNV
jgi:hypothetical protein